MPSSTVVSPGEAAIFHLHGLRLLKSRVLLSNVFPLPKSARIVFYELYMSDLRWLLGLRSSVGYAARTQASTSLAVLRLRSTLRSLRRWWCAFYTPRVTVL